MQQIEENLINQELPQGNNPFHHNRGTKASKTIGHYWKKKNRNRKRGEVAKESRRANRRK